MDKIGKRLPPKWPGVTARLVLVTVACIRTLVSSLPALDHVTLHTTANSIATATRHEEFSECGLRITDI